MARRKRLQVPGATYHLTTRGVRRQRVFLVQEDWEDYVRFLGAATRQYEWRCLSFCLMSNHVHLLIETPEPTLSAGMQWIHSRFAQRFNDRHGHVGHVFERRYRDERIADDLYFMTAAAYVALNPVRAGLCRAPSDWPWSSHGLVARGMTPRWLSHDLLCERLAAASGTTDFFDRLAPVT